MLNYHVNVGPEVESFQKHNTKSVNHRGMLIYLIA